MSKKIIQLSIPKPCSEKWSEMTPTEKGRFCSVCERNLIDFTDFSDDELLRFVKNNNHKICGRFTKNQLDRKIESTSISENKIIQYSKVAGFVLPSLIANEAFSQVSYFEKESPLPASRKEVVFEDSTKQKTNSDQVIIEYNFKILEQATNEPIPGVCIYADGKIIGISDVEGKIKFISDDTLFEIYIKDQTGIYSEKEIDISTVKGNNIFLNIKLYPLVDLYAVGMLHETPKWWQFRKKRAYKMQLLENN